MKGFMSEFKFKGYNIKNCGYTYGFQKTHISAQKTFIWQKEEARVL